MNPSVYVLDFQISWTHGFQYFVPNVLRNIKLLKCQHLNVQTPSGTIRQIALIFPLEGEKQNNFNITFKVLSRAKNSKIPLS